MGESIHRVPCDHADQPHSLYYGVKDGGPPVPAVRHFDNQADALAAIEEEWPAGTAARDRLWLLKLFPTISGEAYTCYQWSPPPWSPPPRPAVQPDRTERLEKDRPRTSKYDVWEGLCSTIVVLTACLLILHWAGVI